MDLGRREAQRLAASAESVVSDDDGSEDDGEEEEAEARSVPGRQTSASRNWQDQFPGDMFFLVRAGWLTVVPACNRICGSTCMCACEWHSSR